MNRSKPTILLVITIAFSFLIQLSHGQRVQYRPEVTDGSGNPISSIASGDSFTFHVYVQDIQAVPMGAFSAYVDVTYDASLFAPNGPIIHSSTYSAGTSGDLSTPGLMDEVGGVDGFSPLGGDEFLVFSVPMISLGPQGTGLFETDPTEELIQHPTIIFGDTTELDIAQISFLSTPLSVVPEPSSQWLLIIGLGGACLRFKRRI